MTNVFSRGGWCQTWVLIDVIVSGFNQATFRHHRESFAEYTPNLQRTSFDANRSTRSYPYLSILDRHKHRFCCIHRCWTMAGKCCSGCGATKAEEAFRGLDGEEDMQFLPGSYRMTASYLLYGWLTLYIDSLTTLA